MQCDFQYLKKDNESLLKFQFLEYTKSKKYELIYEFR